MIINRFFFISKSKVNFYLEFKNIIRNLINIYNIFQIYIKNLKFQKKRGGIKFGNIYVLTDENLKDYSVNISKISQIYFYNKLILPINKNKNLCDKLQIEISNGCEIYNFAKIHINFDVYIKNHKFTKKKNYNFFLEKKDLKNIIRTKKWLKIIIKLKNVVNLKNNKIFIKIKKINFIKFYKDSSTNFISVKTLSVPNKQQPKIIFVVLDGISNKDFFCYSTKFSKNKVFSNLIKEGLYYKNSIAGSTVTGSSVPSLLTNTNLLQHGLFKYDSHLYKGSQFPSKNLKFISEKLLECGYNTAALTNFSRLRPHFGMNIGFHDYTNICSGNFHSSAFFEKTAELLKSSQNEKSFIYLHYFGGHPPFNPEVYYRDKISNNEDYFYYSNIAQSELFIKTIIDYLKQNQVYDNTTLIVTSDHGKTMGNFNKKKYHFTEDRLNVPLIYKPKKNNKIKLVNNIFDQRNINYKQIYTLLSKYEKINLNEKFEINQDNQILWTTITSDYADISYHNFVGYSKLFKWVFKCKVENRKFTINEGPKVFKILNFNYVDEKRNIFDFINKEIIKTAEISLLNYINNSQNKNFEIENQHNNFLNII
jgi:hypothetical protein